MIEGDAVQISDKGGVRGVVSKDVVTAVQHARREAAESFEHRRDRRVHCIALLDRCLLYTSRCV